MTSLPPIKQHATTDGSLVDRGANGGIGSGDVDMKTTL